jgi:hypothetical protein
LGAPFWFDVLNRFVSIRSAGKAPEETAAAAETIADAGAAGRAGGRGRHRESTRSMKARRLAALAAVLLAAGCARPSELPRPGRNLPRTRARW